MTANPSPTLAALLSFIFPGVGQVYAGDVRKGLIWAIPMLLFIVAVLFLVLGGSAAMTSLLTAQKALALVVFNVAFFLYHVAAMIDAYDIVRRERSLSYSRAGGAPIALAALIALAIILHGVPGVFGLDYYNFVSNSAKGRPDVIPQVSFPPIGSLPPVTAPPSTLPTAGSSGTPGVSEPPDETDTPAPTLAPGQTPKPHVCPAIDLGSWAMAADGRVNLLLVGSDSRSDTGVGDASLRTDSMMLLSIEIASCKAALFSFPRNMQEVDATSGSRYPTWFRIPLENGQNYPGFLFGLWRDAASSPSQYPGSDGIGSECQTQFDCERGWRALTGAVQNMAGVQVDGVVAVNLKGFVDVVRNLPSGGVWIDIPSPLQDDAYYNSQQQLMKVDFKPGCQFLDPEETLAYARSRHQDSDYQRERRQQYVLQQVRKQLDPIGLLPHIPGLLQAAQANLFMTISDQDIPFLAQVASRIDADRLYRYDFAPSKLTSLGSMDGMRQKVNDIFSEPEPQPTTKPNDPACPPR